MTDSRNGVAGQLHRRVDMRVVDVADVVAADVVAAAAVVAAVAVAVAVAVGKDLVVVRKQKGSAGRACSRRRHCARHTARLWH